MQIEPGQEHLLATACSDNSICIWDVRKLSQGGKPVSSVTHSLTCQSAYFAPDGVFLCFQKPPTIAVREAPTCSFTSLPPLAHS